MDAVYGMDFARDVHPLDRRLGKVRALETIRFSIPTHRGCYGECQLLRDRRPRGADGQLPERGVDPPGGRSGSPPSPISRGTSSTSAGRRRTCTASNARRSSSGGPAPTGAASFPAVCESLRPDHSRQIALLRKLRRIPGVKQAVVASGIRHDLVLADRKHGIPYLREVVRHHVSGQMKIAPEHSEERVLACMGKPGRESLLPFRDLFRRLTAEAGKEQFLTYYLIAAHPGCSEADMEALRRFASRELAIHPEQVQLFTPTPSTVLHAHVPYRTGPLQRETALRRENCRRPGAAKEDFGCENGAFQVWNSRISTKRRRR